MPEEYIYSETNDGISTIIFDNDYNKKIKPYVLHDNITYIEFPNNFNQSIDPDVLPKNLKFLSFGWFYNKKININVLPNNLEYLIFYTTNYNKKLNVNVLPDSLKYLAFTRGYNQKIEKNVLPQKLTHLSIRDTYSHTFDKGILPDNLEHLELWDHQNIIEPETLPNSLKFLIFGYGYDLHNQNIQIGSIPPNLTHLIFDGRYNRPIDKGVLPDSLIYLNFGCEYNQKIDIDVLPSNLIYLVFSDCYDQPLLINGKSIIPQSVRSVCFNNTMEPITTLSDQYKAFTYDMKIYLRKDYECVNPDESSDHEKYYVEIDDIGDITNDNLYIFDGVNKRSIPFWSVNVSYNSKKYQDISNDIHKLLLIDDMLPMPIAEEINYHIRMNFI